MSEINYVAVNPGSQRISELKNTAELLGQKNSSNIKLKKFILPLIFSVTITTIPRDKLHFDEPNEKTSYKQTFSNTDYREIDGNITNKNRIAFFDLDTLIKDNKEKRRKGMVDAMHKEIMKPIINFEKKVSIFGYILSCFFLILSLPILIGTPALVGVVGSLGLPLYVRIRRWESNINGE